jgi:hypothetical protein
VSASRPEAGLKVILSVDWEPNHGPWDHAGGRDYSGILTGTPALTALLDEWRIPCTWFVEAGWESERDLPRVLGGHVRGLAARTRDEVGLHIHWRRRSGAGGRIAYETSDRSWIEEQIRHGVSSLGSCGVRPTAFRSGALLRVDGLPGLLAGNGFHADSSTLRGRARRLDAVGGGRGAAVTRRVVSAREQVRYPLQPYRADPDDVERVGESGIMEFPIHTGLLEASRPFAILARRLAVSRAARGRNDTFYTVFFHIDELLDPRSRAPGAAEVERAVMRSLSDLVTDLRDRYGASFVTMTEALRRCTGNVVPPTRM